MAKLVLEVESNALSVFTQASNGMNNLSNEVNAFGKEGKESFKKVNDEASKLTNEIYQGSQSLSEFADEAVKLAKGTNIVKELKKQVKEYESAAIKAGEGTKAFTENLAKAGALKDKINDLTKATQSLTGNIGENLGKAAGSSIGIIASGFEGATSASVLLGGHTKDFEQTLLRLQALNGIARFAQELGGIPDKLTEIKLGFAPVIDLYTSANASVIDFAKNSDFSFKSMLTNVKSFVTGGVAGIKEFAVGGIAAVKSFYATMLANPLGIVLAAITAIVGAVILWSEASKENAKKQNEYLDELNKKYQDHYDRLSKLRKAAGKDDSDIRIQAAIKDKVLAQQQIDNIINTTKIAHNQRRKLDEDEQKRLDEAQTKLKNADNEIAVIKIANLHKQTEANIAAIKKSKEESEKYRAIIKKAEEEDAAKRLKAAQDLADALLNLHKQSADAEVSLLYGKEKLDRQKENADKSVDLLRQELIQKQVLAGKGNKLSAEIEAEFLALKLQNAHIYSDGIIDIAVEDANLLASIEETKTKNALDAFDLRQQKLIDAANAVKKPNGVSDEVFELQKQRAVINIQKTGAEERLALEIAELNKSAELHITAAEGEIKQLEGHTDTTSEIKRAALQLDIDTIKAKTPEEVDALKVKYDAQLALLNKALKDNAAAVPMTPIIDWAKILGVTPEKAALIMQGVGEIVNQSKAIVDQQFEAQESALDKEFSIIEQRKSIRDQEIAELESRLSKETDLRREGLANNVDAIKTELAAKVAAGQADIEAQRKIQEEKKKLARQQLVIDTALQGSQMLAAVAKTINTYAAVPPVGIALAALEVAAFITQKAVAFKAIKEGSASNNFAKGVIDLKGPGTKTSDSIPSNLSKGESVFTADETQDNINLFHGIRNKDHKLIEIGIRDLLKNTGVSLNQEAPQKLSQLKSDARTHEINIMLPKKDNANDARFASIEGDMKLLVKQGKNKQYINANGDLVIEKGNITRTIRKKA